MGNVIRKIAYHDDDYESILSKIDSAIHKAEINISTAYVQRRKITALIMFWFSLIYILWLFAFFLFDWPNLSWRNNPVEATQKVAPIILVPLGIYSIRWIVQFYYKRYLFVQEQELLALKKQQKQKVEEMKQKMKYYVAKNLIERYEDPPKHSKAQSSKSQKLNSRPISMTPVQQQKPGQTMPQSDHKSPRNVNFQTPQSTLPSRPVSSTGMSPSSNSKMQYAGYSSVISHGPQASYNRTWVDRVLDLIVGDESNASKYALICEKCFTHNGLALPEEFESVQYSCPKCGHFNAKRKCNLAPKALTQAIPQTPTPQDGPASPDNGRSSFDITKLDAPGSDDRKTFNSSDQSPNFDNNLFNEPGDTAEKLIETSNDTGPRKRNTKRKSKNNFKNE